LSFDCLAIFFILAAPYLNHIEYHGFVLELPNLFVFLILLFVSMGLATLLRVVPFPLLRVSVLTGLLLIFIDIEFSWIGSWGGKLLATGLSVFLLTWMLRRHISQILSVIFGAIFLGTLAISVTNLLSHNNLVESRKPADPTTDLPIYVHIILDELMGTAGFDEERPTQRSIKNEMLTFFIENNFRIFRRAYSPYYDSINSIATTVNLTVTENPEKLFIHQEDFQYELLKNTYLSEIHAKGYNINIYQSTYMDFCNSIDEISQCLTYRPDGATSTALSPLTNYEKTIKILALYNSQSFFHKELKRFYTRLRQYLKFQDVLPAWEKWAKKLGPIPVLPVFDRLIEDISHAKRGTMFFAHLLIPHFPYSVNSACEIRRPILEWETNVHGFTTKSIGQSNTAESQIKKYKQYIAQIQCALMKVEKIFDTLKARGLFEDAIIIIHGDHGSRIVRTQPVIENKHLLTTQDHLDAFSAFFAVKSPKIPPGYSMRIAALPELLSDYVSGSLHNPKLANDKKNPFVFLRTVKDETTLTKVPMPFHP